jgi:hypothetical protein
MPQRSGRHGEIPELRISDARTQLRLGVHLLWELSVFGWYSRELSSSDNTLFHHHTERSLQWGIVGLLHTGHGLGRTRYRWRHFDLRPDVSLHLCWCTCMYRGLWMLKCPTGLRQPLCTWGFPSGIVCSTVSHRDAAVPRALTEDL